MGTCKSQMEMLKNPLVVAAMVGTFVYFGLESFKPDLVYKKQNNPYPDYVNAASLSAVAALFAFLMVKRQQEGLAFQYIDNFNDGGDLNDAAGAFHDVPPQGDLISPLPPLPGLPVMRQM